MSEHVCPGCGRPKIKGRAVIYVRDLPDPEILYSEPRFLYLEWKWRHLLEHLKDPEVQTIYVPNPETLGDNYFEVMANLSHLARGDKWLRVGKPSKMLRYEGEVDLR